MSSSSSNIIQSKVQNLPEVGQLHIQEKAKTDRNIVAVHENAVTDKKNTEGHAKKEVEQGRHGERKMSHAYPKVRTGCLTCKIRKVKCDEGKPSCLRCTSTGRKCEGYNPPRAKVHILTGDTSAKPSGKYDSTDGWSAKGSQHSSGFSSHSHGTIHTYGSGGLELTSDELEGAKSYWPLRSNPITQDASLGRRLLDVATSLLLLEDLIEPDTVSVIAKYDSDLYEVVVDLLLECASQLNELGSRSACWSHEMLILVDAIKDAPRFKQERLLSSQPSSELSADALLSKVEREVDLLMSLATTIEDVMNDLDSYVVVPPQQHSSKHCDRHVQNQIKTEPTQVPPPPISSDPQPHDPSIESTWILVAERSEDSEATPYCSDVPPASAEPTTSPKHNFDPTGQTAPAGVIPKVTCILWEDEGSLCFLVKPMGVVVGRREDNHFINGTSLLKVAEKVGSRQTCNLELEKIRHVVEAGPTHLRGIWIPFDRALEFANLAMITDHLYPLFVYNIGALLYNPENAAPRRTVWTDE